MNLNTKPDWITLATGFWVGVAVISLINIVLFVFHRDQFLYDEYIFVVSVVVVLIYAVLGRRPAPQ